QFWGPGANIKSTQWIADASILTDKWHNPTLSLIYLPHLDYCLQKFGPDLSKIGEELKAIDVVITQLVNYFESKNAEIIILSEYGIAPVNNPIHLNRLFCENDLLQIRMERGLELLDPGASKAFVVADHQVAHVYINDPSVTNKVKDILEKVRGIELILDKTAQQTYHIDNDRSGDLVLMADAQSWFTYYFWLDDAVAPDYARAVDIHKKPGYDPVEMFMTSKLRAGYKLLRKKVGLRYVMDVIPLDATLIKGSHGRVGASAEFHPVIITNNRLNKKFSATEVYNVIWDTLN
ncbi:MAG TPA: alkaline phosphatase family protein, partial [Hanamia sp.]|nr:alkaline phosphatase family protein [Hanamia sp.]